MTTWFIRYGDTKFGGAENYLRRVVSALEEKNEDVGVFSTGRYGYKNIILPKKGKLPSWIYLNQMAKGLKDLKSSYNGIFFALERLPCADIYRAGDGVHKAWLEIKAKRQSRIKTAVESLNPLHKTYLNLEAETFTNSKIIISNSNRGADEIAHYYNIPKSKIRVIYNGVPHPVMMPDKALAKAALATDFGLMSNVPLILYAGSGFFRKGVMDFLEILSFLRTPFNAIVVGKDKKAQKYISHAASLGLQNSVKFAGSQTDMAKFYSAADLFLFPTLYEPFSNACLEAMGYGAVLFTTAQNGVSEILQDSTFIIQDNIQASNILGALLVDSIALERLSIKHRQIALNYSVEKNINASLAVIDELR
jgi:UDP-glucose:(heptosyl)LPS alpha-1,3-glucosyltransferase